MERKRSSVRRQRKYRRPWWKKCKEYVRNFIAFMFSNVGIIGLVVGYTIAGSLIFRALERNQLIQVNYDAVHNRTLYAKKIWNITKKLNSEVRLRDIKDGFEQAVMDELFQYQKLLVNLTRKGYDGNDDIYGTKQWSFAGAFLYSLTVITTIGYGNIFPHTPQGKMTTIIYAIIGMPLFLLYLSNIGDVMARSFKWIYANMCLCRWCPGVAKRRAERRIKRAQQLRLEYESDNENGDDASSSNTSRIEGYDLAPRDSIISEVLTAEEDYDVQTVTVPVTICLMIMVGYICGGAILFCRWESWSFIDASYFCFISLSTIGFGDLVPGDKIYGYGDDLYTEILELSFVFCSMYLMLGMALIAMCFNLMQEDYVMLTKTNESETAVHDCLSRRDSFCGSVSL